jgi:hypothetical protein
MASKNGFTGCFSSKMVGDDKTVPDDMLSVTFIFEFY